MGVYSREVVEAVAEVLKNLGSEKALIVHGLDGMDEVSISEETFVAELSGGIIKTYTIKPEDFCVKRVPHKELAVKSPEESGAIIMRVLEGGEGAARDVVILNGACALVVADMADTIREGIKLAARSIDSGKAMVALKKLIEISNIRKS